MNKKQRTQLDKLSDQIADIKDELENMRDEENDKVDSMRENFEGTDNFQRMEAGAEALDEACSDLDTVIDSLNTAMD